jgi:hypothetical protein
MAEITGMLLSDLLPNGTVRITFVTDDDRNEPAIKVKDLDAAEADFTGTFGLTPELAAALRYALEQHKVFCLETTIDGQVAAIFSCYPRTVN